MLIVVFSYIVYKLLSKLNIFKDFFNSFTKETAPTTLANFICVSVLNVFTFIDIIQIVNVRCWIPITTWKTSDLKKHC